MNEANNRAQELLLIVEDEERIIEAEIIELQSDLNGIRRLKHRILSNRKLKHEILPKMTRDVVGPQKAIQMIIDSQPDRKWTPKEVTRRFALMIKSGEVDTKIKPTTPLVTVVHGILIRLRSKGYIERGGYQGRHWHRKIIKQELRLR